MDESVQTLQTGSDINNVDVLPQDQGIVAQHVTNIETAVPTAADTEEVSPTTAAPPATGDTNPVSPTTTVAATPRSEKRKSHLPVPGSRLPLRKSSNPSLSHETSTSTTATTVAPRSPSKSPRLSLPTPRLQTGLRRPSAGGVSPVRSPIRSSGGGLSPGLKSQSSNSSLKSPGTPGTPTRIGLPLPRSPTNAGRSVSTSAASSPISRGLPKLAGAPGMGSRRASGVPTITKTPSKDTIKPAVTTTTPVSATRTTPQPKKVTVTPRLPAGRKSLPASTSTTPKISSTAENPTPTKSTLTARQPLRSRSFQSIAKPDTSSPAKTTFSTPQPKPVSAAPRTGSIKVSKPRSRPSVIPSEPVEPVDKRQRALASSQALRNTIAAAKAARKSSGAANATNNNNWPEVIVAGVDDKEPEEEKPKDDYPYSDDSDAPPEDEEEKLKTLDIRPGGILDLTYKSLDNFDDEVVAETNTVLAKVLLLQRNSLSIFPPVLSRFSGLYTLDLSCNAIKGDAYLSKHMSFPYLKTLLIHTNFITSLEPIFEFLDMPRLNYLDVHANRLTSYPKGLTRTFGALTTFVASDNQIEEVQLDGLQGLQVLDLMNNSLGTLPPKLGLFEGLRELRVVGNLFRVPRRQVLEKTTEEVLEWLRDRIPEGERYLETAPSGSGEGGEEGGDDGNNSEYASAEERENGWDVVGREEARGRKGRGGYEDEDLD